MSILNDIIDSVTSIGQPLTEALAHYWWVVIIAMVVVAYMVIRGGI